MTMNARRVAAGAFLSALTVLAACAPARKGASARNEGGVSFERGATVLEGIALQDGPGSLLAAMAGKVPSFRVERKSGQCPSISLRSQISFQGVVMPHVYVDGTRALDTCILDSLQTADVERVEVYPLGFTTRPGYGTHSHGLILVFLRST
jgi:hypothetical protein